MNIKITDSSYNLELFNRRDDWKECPKCHHKEPNYLKWAKYSKEIILKSNIPNGKDIIIIAECPMCFELVWGHWDINDFLRAMDEENIILEKKILNRLLTHQTKDRSNI